MTARTPSSFGPLAAQSRELPVPYSLPAMTISGVSAPWYSSEASKTVITLLVGTCSVQAPSWPGVISLRRRILPKVPRTITSWLPRRAPYWLNSAGSTPSSVSSQPAALLVEIEPAGEMWSVVIESASFRSTRAFSMSVGGGGVGDRLLKYGGSLTYVECGFQSYSSPVGTGSPLQRSSPSKTLA